MPEYNRYPAMDANNNFPPAVRQAMANSPEQTAALNGAVRPMVATAIAEDVTILESARLAAGSAVDVVLKEKNLLDGSDPRLVERLTNLSPYAYVITDLNDNVLFAINKDGTLLELEEPVVEPEPLPFAPITIPRSSGYIYALVDLDDNLIYGIRSDSTIEGTVTKALNVPVKEVATFEPNNYHVESSGTEGSKSLILHNIKTGARTVLTSGSNDTNPSLRSDGDVVFLRNGVEYFIPAKGGAVHKVVAGPDITTWGDSLTQANGWQNRLRELLPGRTITNEGIGSQTSMQIAMRQGGLDAPMQVANDTIPASGPVTITQGLSKILLATNHPVRSTTGTLGGVPGTLSTPGGTADTPYVFTRTTPGEAVKVSNPVNFYTDSQFVGEDRIVTFYNGRNNTAEPVWEHIDGMVNRLTSKVKRFLIISTTSSSSEVAGTAGYDKIKNINDKLRAKWGRWEDGGNFVDLQKHINENAMSIMKLTPTDADKASIAGGALPPQVMIYTAATNTYDSLHFSTDTQTKVIAPYIYAALVSKGWV